MTQFVLGVDGGTTKTHCALFDIEGNKIDFLEFGSANHEVMPGSFMELEEKLSEMIEKILKRNNIGIESIVKSVFGLSGVDTRYQHAQITGILSGIGMQSFILCNDSYLGIKAGCQSGKGICVINGTGCTVCGIDDNGRVLQIGGQGEITGDAGGGGYLGRHAVQAAYNYMFRCKEETLMTNMLCTMLNIGSKYDFIEIIREKNEKRELRMSELSKVVFTAANEGDRIALDILECMGREIAYSINGMIRELDFERQQPLDIVLAGSTNVKGENPTAINKLKEDVLAANENRAVNFILLQQSPVYGAVIWALQEVHGDNSLYNKVINQQI